MAVEQRRDASGKWRWRAYWKSPVTGKKESGPWCKDESEARRLSDEMLYRLKHERDSLIATTARDQCTIAVLLLRYIESGEIKPSDRATKAHLTAMARELGELQACEVTPAVIEDLQARMTSGPNPIRRNTFRRRATAFQTALRWAVSQGLLHADPTAGARVSPGADRKFIPPSPREVALYVSLAPEHVRRVLICGFYLGARVGPCELFKLQWGNFDLDQGALTFEGARKGALDEDDSTLRQIAIHPTLLPHLEGWYATDRLGHIPWVIHWREKPIKSISKAWQSLKKKAETYGARPFRPYDLRHAFATYAIAGGASDKVVAELMGLKSTAMIHKHYQYVLNPQRSAAVDALPALPETGDPWDTTVGHQHPGKPQNTVDFDGGHSKKIQ